MLRKCLLILTASLLATAVHAHRLQTVLTTISWNPNTQLVEVIHQTHAHDVEYALFDMLESQNGLENIRAQALASIELVKSFRLWDGAGNEISLSLVGAELEADYFYIYQEVDLDEVPPDLRIEHGMLRNNWPEMQNYLNVEYADSLKSLIFSGDDGRKSLSRN